MSINNKYFNNLFIYKFFNSPSLRIENCVSQEFFMITFMEKAFLKHSLRVHQKFLLIIWWFLNVSILCQFIYTTKSVGENYLFTNSRLTGNYLIKNAIHCSNNILLRLNINLWSLIYTPCRTYSFPIHFLMFEYYLYRSEQTLVSIFLYTKFSVSSLVRVTVATQLSVKFILEQLLE